ncbi:MAG: MarR family transcriptional regulator, partial [Alphaproteobacteria bacterium]|nr:MarR family transcriptional regulator [Alphaproteobacteria bacterium]
AIAPVFDDMVNALGADNIRAALPFLRELRGQLERDD